MRAEAAAIERDLFARLWSIVAHAGVGIEAEQEIRCHHGGLATVADHHYLVNAGGSIRHGHRPVAVTVLVDRACEDRAASQAFGIDAHGFARPEVHGPGGHALARRHDFRRETG